MSIYKITSSEPKMICCSFFYQLKDLTEEQIIKSIKGFHQYLNKETEKIEKSIKKYEEKVLEKNTETLLTILNEYLHTPLQGDKTDIRNILIESLAKIGNQLTTKISSGLELSYSSQVNYLPTQYALLKRLEKTGFDHLRNLGFDSGNESNKVYESVFIFESSLNLDLVDFMITKKKFDQDLPIFNQVQSDNIIYLNSLYNLIYSNGASVSKFLEKNVFEAALVFSKPTDVTEDIFQSALIEALDKMWVSLKIPYITLMRQKLGFANVGEYLLRIFLLEDHENLTETLRWLSMYKEVGFLRQTIIDEGKLIAKKLIK